MTDRFTVRAVVISLAAVALLVVIALTALMLFGDLTAEQSSIALGTLGTIGSAAVGAVAGVLASTRSGEGAAAAPTRDDA